MPSFSTAERISLTASLTFWVTPSSCGWAFFRYSTSSPSFGLSLLPLQAYLPTVATIYTTAEFPDASFDTLVGALSLCPILDGCKGISEMRRVPRPGGHGPQAISAHHPGWDVLS